MSNTKSHKAQLFNQAIGNNSGYSPSQRSNKFQKSVRKSQQKPSRYSSKKSAHKSASKRPQGSITLKNKLIEFLIKAAEIERKLQIIKQTLCEEQNFTPASLFKRIDRDQKGYLLEKDIQKFLIETKTGFKGSELKNLYGKMNVDKLDKGVMLWQFQNFILPNQNPKLRYFAMRRPVYIPLPDERLDQKIQWLLSKLFTEIMKQQAKLDQIKSVLISSYDFRPQLVFQYLTDHEDFVTCESLTNFMQNQNCQISIEQVGCLIKLFDKHGEGRVYFEDFKYFLATLGLKKQHQIFDELSPIPTLKNFTAPVVKSILNREGTLMERLINNKISGL